MNIQKTAGLLCCVLGVANMAYAGGNIKWNPFKRTPKLPAVHMEADAYRGFESISAADIKLGQALLRSQLPQIGGATYARKVGWGNRLANISPMVSERLVASRVLASSFPGYEVNFPKTFRAFKENTELSWTRELLGVLNSYGSQAQFSGSFETSLQSVLNLSENAPFKWHGAEEALEEAWFAAMEKKSGFFTIRVKSPVFLDGHEDILLLDMSNRRLISLDKSILAAKAQNKPAGDTKTVPIGQEKEVIGEDSFAPSFTEIRAAEARIRAGSDEENADATTEPQTAAERYLRNIFENFSGNK